MEEDNKRHEVSESAITDMMTGINSIVALLSKQKETTSTTEKEGLQPSGNENKISVENKKEEKKEEESKEIKESKEKPQEEKPQKEEAPKKDKERIETEGRQNIASGVTKEKNSGQSKPEGRNGEEKDGGRKNGSKNQKRTTGVENYQGNIPNTPNVTTGNNTNVPTSKKDSLVPKGGFVGNAPNSYKDAVESVSIARLDDCYKVFKLALSNENYLNYCLRAMASNPYSSQPVFDRQTLEKKMTELGYSLTKDYLIQENDGKLSILYGDAQVMVIEDVFSKLRPKRDGYRFSSEYPIVLSKDRSFAGYRASGTLPRDIVEIPSVTEKVLKPIITDTLTTLAAEFGFKFAYVAMVVYLSSLKLLGIVIQITILKGENTYASLSVVYNKTKVKSADEEFEAFCKRCEKNTTELITAVKLKVQSWLADPGGTVKEPYVDYASWVPGGNQTQLIPSKSMKLNIGNIRYADDSYY